MTGLHSLSLACTPTPQTHSHTHAQLHMKAQKLSSSLATLAGGATTGTRDGPVQSAKLPHEKPRRFLVGPGQGERKMQQCRAN